jgi:hypothetical protein
MNSYRCYGLTIRSAIELPELGVADASAPADVEILVTDAESDDRPPAVDQPHFLWREAESVGLEVPGVGRFRVDRGDRIVVSRRPGADERDIRLFLLGTAMGALMVQRGHLVLHGNALRVGDACGIVVGHSGAGKSTLAAEFVRREYEVLADDVVPVNGSGQALPGYPRLKLWLDALSVLDLSAQNLDRVTATADKFHVPVARGPLSPLPVRWIFVLESHASSELQLQTARGVEAYELLREHTYRPELIHDDTAFEKHLRQCSALVGTARVVRVLRPAASMTPSATADAILAAVGAHSSIEEATIKDIA